jgi:hypothetical protein
MATTPADTHELNGNKISEQLFWNSGPGGDGTVEYWNLAGGQTNPTAVKLGTVNNTQYDFLGTGDFNGDGTTDIAWLSQAASPLGAGHVIVWAVNAGGTGATAKDVGTFSTATYNALAIGDFNNDGTSDILFQNISGVTQGTGLQAIGTNGWVVWNFSTGLTTSAAAVTIGGVGAFHNPSTEAASNNFGVQADGAYFKGGGTDILLKLNATNGGTFQIEVPKWNAGLGVYDLDQQALGTHPFGADAAGGDQLPYVWNIDVNVGDGNVGNANVFDNVPDLAAALVTPTGDFNGDGVQDILWMQPDGGVGAGGNFLITTEFMNNGAALNGAAGEVFTGAITWPDWALMGTGDYNGDGTTDMVFYNTVNGAVETWDIVNGAITATPIEGHATPGAGWHLIA